jgi:thiol-disulfide isomerase/thioredoxin
MKKLISLSLIVLLVICATAQQKPETASKILTTAYKQTEDGKKNVLVIFHASWCGWCHKMDSSILDKKCKGFFDANYVIVHLTVEESPTKKYLENPGAAELKKKYLGDKAGLPFWIILNNKGSLLADSYLRKKGISNNEAGDNIGCPAAENEVGYFISVLKKTSALSKSELSIIANRFRENEVK